MDAMRKAGVLNSSNGLHPASAATTLRIRNDKTEVLDGPYADSKEQLGGFHLIEVADLDEALAWAARSPTALHGIIEVRPVRDQQLTEILAELTDDVNQQRRRQRTRCSPRTNPTGRREPTCSPGPAPTTWRAVPMKRPEVLNATPRSEPSYSAGGQPYWQKASPR